HLLKSMAGNIQLCNIKSQSRREMINTEEYRRQNPYVAKVVEVGLLEDIKL
ncbi:hypothetical protein STEG23_023687, partial [Scotinomys teguina]